MQVFVKAKSNNEVLVKGEFYLMVGSIETFYSGSGKLIAVLHDDLKITLYDSSWFTHDEK